MSWSIWESSSWCLHKFVLSWMQQVLIRIRCLKSKVIYRTFRKIWMSMIIFFIINQIDILDNKFIIRKVAIMMCSWIQMSWILEWHVIMLNYLRTDCFLLDILKGLTHHQRLAACTYNTANEFLFSSKHVLWIAILQWL